MTVNIKGRLMDFDIPKVMGIVNATPDSFYAGSRTQTRDAIRSRVSGMMAAGVDIIDVGAYSSRPGADEVSPAEEIERLDMAMDVVREVAGGDFPVSVDTFRADVARHCVKQWGVDIINDIGGGTLDPEIWETVAGLRVAYVLMHMRGTPADMQKYTDYGDVTAEVITDLARKVYELRGLGVNDIIIDPGFGFAKTVEQNFELLDNLDQFASFNCPVLVGISRKSMIYKTLDTDAYHGLNGTTVLNAFALDRGANILRVHDVGEAKECVRLFKAMTRHHAEPPEPRFV